MATGGRASGELDVVDLTGSAAAAPDPRPAPGAHRAGPASRAALALACAGALLAVGGLARATAPVERPDGAEPARATGLASAQAYQEAAERALADVAPGSGLDWRLSSVRISGSRQAPPLELERQSAAVTDVVGAPRSVQVLRLGYRVASRLPAGADGDPCAAPVMDVRAWASDPAGREGVACTPGVTPDGLRWGLRESREVVSAEAVGPLGEAPPQGEVVVRSVTLVLGDWACSVAGSAAVRERRGGDRVSGPVQPPLTTAQLQDVARALADART